MGELTFRGLVWFVYIVGMIANVGLRSFRLKEIRDTIEHPIRLKEAQSEVIARFWGMGIVLTIEMLLIRL